MTRRFWTKLWRRAAVPAASAAAVLLAGQSAHAAGFAEAAGRGVASALLFALTAGLLTALTPCVYPMIPITIAVFGGKAGVGRGRAVALATAYVAGIAAMFGALGTVFALLGRSFGTFLANPWVVVPIALLFVALGLSMFGAFELALPPALQARLSRVGGRGLLGAFLMGLVGGLIAAPCTGPPLAGMLAYVATTRDALYGFVLLATYAVGIGVPFWLVAGFSMSLPRSGPWMDSVKSIFGVALFVAALYFLRNVVPSLAGFTSPHPAFAATMVALVLLGVAAGGVHLRFSGTSVERARKVVGIALVTVGLFGGINYLLTPKPAVALYWHRSEPAALAAARGSGQPILIDFMADWCLPCKEMEVQVFAHPQVIPALQELTLLRVDLTREDDDPEAAAVKKKYGAETLPALRVLAPDGRLLAGADTVLNVDGFLDLLARARAARSSGR